MSDTPVPRRPRPTGFGAWDAREIGRPGLVRIGEAFWLFYAGCDVRFEWRVGAAISADGLTWDRLSDGPLIIPPGTRRSGGGWHGFLDPSARLDAEGGIRLYACGLGDAPGTAIVSLTSRNAVDWGEPRAELVSAGWDGEAVNAFRSPWSVTDPSGTEALFVTRVRTFGNGQRDTAIARFDRRPGGEWVEAVPGDLRDPEGGEIDHPCVVRDASGGWRLWCSSHREGTWRILGTTAGDRGTWLPLRVVVEGDPASPLQTAGVFGPAVVTCTEGYLMLHMASSRTSDGMSIGVFARRSRDGDAWEPASSRPVLTPRPGISARPW